MRGWALLPLCSERYPDALAAFQTAYSIKPEHPALANNLGQTYVALRRYDDAIASFRLGDRMRRIIHASPRISSVH